MNEELKQQLLDLERADKDKRLELLKDGCLFDGYVPQMEQLHVENAKRLADMLDEHGWPGVSLVGEDGTRAAWMVAQNAISQPEFQRRCLEELERAVQIGEAPQMFAAYLTDRIRFNERRPQVFGTVFDWDENGQLNPWKIEEEADVDARRERAGLPPLEAAIEIVRLEAQLEGNNPPQDPRARHRDVDDWARRVGWR
jgi:hypothetical protein